MMKDMKERADRSTPTRIVSSTEWWSACPSARPRDVIAAIAFLIPALVPTADAYAARVPGVVDAACEALDLRYRSVASRATARELDFFLFEAAGLGCAGLAGRLLAAGASVEARDRDGDTALLIAARMGQDEMLELLVERGADVHRRNLAGATALLHAVTMNRRRTSEWLLGAGVDPALADAKGLVPLIAAAYNGNERLVETLLAAGADPTVADASGRSALVYAAGKGFRAVVERLLAKAAADGMSVGVDRRDARGLTPLMWAAGYSNDVPASDGIATVEVLLAAGADTAPRDDRGRDALMIAAGRRHAGVVVTLLAAGAGAHGVDREGKSARDLAAGDVDVIAALDAATNDGTAPDERTSEATPPDDGGVSEETAN